MPNVALRYFFSTKFKDILMKAICRGLHLLWRQTDKIHIDLFMTEPRDFHVYWSSRRADSFIFC